MLKKHFFPFRNMCVVMWVGVWVYVAWASACECVWARVSACEFVCLYVCVLVRVCVRMCCVLMWVHVCVRKFFVTKVVWVQVHNMPVCVYMCRAPVVSLIFSACRVSGCTIGVCHKDSQNITQRRLFSLAWLHRALTLSKPPPLPLTCILSHFPPVPVDISTTHLDIHSICGILHRGTQVLSHV